MPCPLRYRRAHWQWRNNAWSQKQGRAAAIYIFAHHPIFDPAVADHRDPDQWDFYVVAANALPQQKSIGLAGVRTRAEPVGFSGLLDRVRKCAAELKDSSAE